MRNRPCCQLWRFRVQPAAPRIRERLVVEEEHRSWLSSWGAAIVIQVGLRHPHHAQWSPARLSWAGPAGPLRPRALLTLLGLAIGPMMRYISFWLVAAEFCTPKAGRGDGIVGIDGT